MDGDEVAGRTLAGVGAAELRRRALDLGATDLLTKPFEAEEAIARLRSALRLKSYQDHVKSQQERLEQKVAQRTAELADSRLDILWRLGKAAEFRDEATGHHVLRVACYSRLLGEALGLAPEQVEPLFLASPLHDLGKLGIPDHILSKPGTLSPAEWAVMQRHCEIGARILRQPPKLMKTLLVWRGVTADHAAARVTDPLLEVAATIALAHHERWDGTGYPAGLRGNAIPLPARIVAVADAYDALRSDRPYRPALPAAQAQEVFAQEAGTHFDPDIYAAFVSCAERFDVIQQEFADGHASLCAQA